jgi:hypothetical protein
VVDKKTEKRLASVIIQRHKNRTTLKTKIISTSRFLKIKSKCNFCLSKIQF